MGVTTSEFTGAGGRLIFNNVSLDYNGTTVQCIYTTIDGNDRRTNNGTLLVQGKDTYLFRGIVFI